MSSGFTRGMSSTSASEQNRAAALSFRGQTWGLEREAAAADGRCAPAGAEPGEGARPSPLSLIPIRFALPITAFRDGAPSARAMTLALLPSNASLLRISIASSVHSISRPCLPMRPHRRKTELTLEVYSIC
jgi:hypothetical protein